jgi:hypothetical protein
MHVYYQCSRHLGGTHQSLADSDQTIQSALLCPFGLAAYKYFKQHSKIRQNTAVEVAYADTNKKPCRDSKNH